MIKIAIVDDDENDVSLIKSFLEKFETEEKNELSISVFNNGLLFLDEHKSKVFDAIFLDIEMPHCNGIEVATKLREFDEAVPLIFITNMGQFAIHGYEVDAIAFVLKPLNYSRFCVIFQKALARLTNRNKYESFVQTSAGKRRINLLDVYYIKVEDHLLVYYTKNGFIETWQPLKDVEKSIPMNIFAKCNKSTLINCKHVDAIEKDIVSIGEDKIPIARREKKEFMSKFTLSFGE